jgi:hypothetical protein
MEKLKTKQGNETKNVHSKMNSMFNAFKRRRALDFDNLVQKYKNKHKDLELQQSNELKRFKMTQMKTSITKSHSMNSKKYLIMFLESEINYMKTREI